MSLEFARTAALFAATLTTGLMAGLFYAFTCAVMPGLRRCSDRTFIETMQGINVAIINGWFMVCFIGALVPGLASVLLHLGDDVRAVLAWSAAGLVLHIAMLVITFRINVPLNNQIDRAGAVDSIADPAAVRRAFEPAWVRWNLVRTVLNIAGFACFICAVIA
jgi:uncharacterized membrane protein